jgi:hypothetical protein
MYYGGGEMTQVNNGSQPLTSDFVSLALKGRTDGFTLKGGDATKGLLATQYDGPRPDRTIAGTCGGGGGEPVQLEKCVAGNANQANPQAILTLIVMLVVILGSINRAPGMHSHDKKRDLFWSCVGPALELCLTDCL